MRITKLSAVVGTVAILAGLLVFTSCGGSKEDAGVKMGAKSPRIEGEGSEPDLAETAEWPADMFEGVPVFTFGKIERVSKGREGGMMKFNISFHGMEKRGIEQYVELLKEAGWQVSLNTAGESGGILGGEKDDLGLNFMFNGEDGTGVLAVFSSMK